MAKQERPMPAHIADFFKGFAPLVKRHEGLRLRPYHCTAGKLTIGYGRNLQDVGISEDEAEYLLGRDVWSAYLSACTFFPRLDTLTTARQHVLVSMSFQLGHTRMRGFKKFEAALSAGDYQQAAAEMLNSAWARQTPQRVKELAIMMVNG